MSDHGSPNVGDSGLPNPGSDEAIKQGCICPRMDNGRGNPEIGRIRGFVVVIGCKVHSPRRRYA